MRASLFTFAALTLVTLGCQSDPANNTTNAAQVVEVDPAQRAELFDAVSALAGEWKAVDGEGTAAQSVFKVTSANSVVCETMFPGAEHEMTNMYALDGSSLVMTHYCGAGNQPTMRAAELVDGELVFKFDRVQDLKSLDEVYMGEMTLKFVGADNIEQHWSALKNGELDHEMVFVLERVR